MKCAGKPVPKDVGEMISRLSPRAVLDQNVKLKTGLYKMLKPSAKQPEKKKLILLQDNSADDVNQYYERSAGQNLD